MCTNRSSRLGPRAQLGLTIVELILFIVIVGVAVAGILSVMNITVKSSADPMERKQAIAIAEALLSEVEQQPFTWCDPQDANVLTATSAAGCTAGNDQNNGGGALSRIPATETRGSTGNPFDNVADYNGYSQSPPTDIAGGNAVAGYTSTVTITRAGGAAPFAALPAGAALKISVRVSGPGGTDITLVGYRLRYAPNAAG
jgi:MSHA pilin protein MshD